MSRPWPRERLRHEFGIHPGDRYDFFKLRNELDEILARVAGGNVFVSDAMGARGLSFDFVVVLGMVEKSFPRLIREDPLLLDAERRSISPALPLKCRGHDEEKLLFDLTRQVARDQLILSYPRLEAGTSRPRVPSVFLLEMPAARPVNSDMMIFGSMP